MLLLLSNQRDSSGVGRTRQIDDYKDGLNNGEAIATSFAQAEISNDNNSSNEGYNKQMKHVICYSCGEKGHILKNCPKFKKDEAGNKKDGIVSAFMTEREKQAEKKGRAQGWLPY